MINNSERQKKLDILNVYTEALAKYQKDWLYLDSMRVPKIFHFLYPAGFIMEMRILRKKSKLTKEYEEFSKAYAEEHFNKK